MPAAPLPLPFNRPPSNGNYTKTAFHPTARQTAKLQSDSLLAPGARLPRQFPRFARLSNRREAARRLVSLRAAGASPLQPCLVDSSAAGAASRVILRSPARPASVIDPSL